MSLMRLARLYSAIQALQKLYGCGGMNRTYDLRIMSPTSYHCSTPRYILEKLCGDYIENSWESIPFLISVIRFCVRGTWHVWSCWYLMSSESATDMGFWALSLRCRSRYDSSAWANERKSSLCASWYPPISLYISQNASRPRTSAAIALTSPRAITHSLASIHACHVAISTHGIRWYPDGRTISAWPHTSTSTLSGIGSNMSEFARVSEYTKIEIQFLSLSSPYWRAISVRDMQGG